MRILYCTDTFLPEVNGVTTVLETMRSGLRSRGHQVSVAAPRYDRPAPDESEVRRLAALPCPGYPQVRLSWPWGRSLQGEFDRFAPDLVHVVTEGPLGVFGRSYALRRRLPMVSSFHTDFPRYAERYLGRFAVGPTRRWLRWFHQAARLTQTPSEATRQELLSLGIAHATVWGRGVDTSWFRPARRSESRRAALGAAGRTLVLHVGRLAVEKGVDTLVAAFRRAHEVLGDEALFCVAGDGPRAAPVRGALPFAVHRGFLDRGTLADLYADADLFVFPSPTETCGLVALEALASGVPVIGAAAGGIPESLRQGLTGFLVPPGDAGGFAEGIVQLVRDGSQRAAMHEAARAFAVGRDWSRELDELEAAYGSARWAKTPAAAPSSWPTSTSVA
ncbi:MAG TPA: glycosyltransferase family 1 protein [Gemmatimonadales bacterium]|nr:glycosyltransferase family 1 protein [Gemmatimonadales bacterium]